MTEAQRQTPRPELSDLTEAERELALKRFYLLRPFLEDGVPLSRVIQASGQANGQTGGLKLRTAQHWVRRYHQAGLAGLVRQPRAAIRARRQISPELRKLIEGLALRSPRPTVAFVHRQVSTVATQHE